MSKPQLKTIAKDQCFIKSQGLNVRFDVLDDLAPSNFNHSDKVAISNAHFLNYETNFFINCWSKFFSIDLLHS